MIVVTGATGQLGREVIAALLRSGTDEKIVAAVRSPEKPDVPLPHQDEVRRADYTDVATLDKAFAGASKLLLISGTDIGSRVPQHQAVLDAAARAGVQLLAYTSILNADTSTLLLASEHKATEATLRASGVPFVLLRNGWYTENHTGSLQSTLQHGAVLGAARDGRFAAAPRRDYAEAAATVLTTPGHQNKIYELGGDQPYTLAEYAETVSQVAGRAVVYRNLSLGEYAAMLVGFGLPEPVAHGIANADDGASRGELTTASGDLCTLLGRPTTPVADTVRAALKA